MRPLLLPWLLLGLVVPALVGCEIPDFLGEGDTDPPLPGRRIAIMALDRGVQADPGLADLPVQLPPPYRNGDWSQPGGVQTHAMYHLALGASPQLLWERSIGEGAEEETRILAQPLVVGDFLFAMDAEAGVSGYDARSGRRIWSIDLGEATTDEEFIGGGLAYSGGRLFVTTGFAQIFALDARNGAILWNRQLSGPVRGGAAVFHDQVYVVTLSNQTVALKAETGEVVWTHTGVEEIASLLGSATPAVVEDRVIVPYSSGEIYALRPADGRVVWSDSLAAIAQVDPLADIAQVRGLPVIDRGVLYGVSHAGRMVAFDMQRGTRRWRADLGGVETPWVAGDFIFMLTNDSQVVCLLRKNGAIRWVRPLPRFEDPEDADDPIQWYGPILAGDRLLLASSAAQAVAISPYSGEILGAIGLPDGAATSPVVANETLYIMTVEGDLIAYR